MKLFNMKNLLVVIITLSFSISNSYSQDEELPHDPIVCLEAEMKVWDSMKNSRYEEYLDLPESRLESLKKDLYFKVYLITPEYSDYIQIPWKEIKAKSFTLKHYFEVYKELDYFHRLSDFLKYRGEVMNNMLVLASWYLCDYNCGRDYIKALKLYLKMSLREKVPLYSLYLSQLNHIYKNYVNNSRQLIYNFNGEEFNKKVFKIEKDIIDFLEFYNKGLIEVLNANIEHDKIGIPAVKSMPNYNGSASTEYCQLDHFNQIPLLLYLKPPPPLERKDQKEVVIVDIGSGWGPCAKQLALLGYTVYSIDTDVQHINHQLKNFCKMPKKDTFFFKHWEAKNFEKLKDSNLTQYDSLFQADCKKAKKNIKYIIEDFSNEGTVNIINKKKWDIVLSLDSIQFMNDEQNKRAFKAVNDHLTKSGIFIIKNNRKLHYSGTNVADYTYDFDLHNKFSETFTNYKILQGLIRENDTISGLTLYKTD